MNERDPVLARGIHFGVVQFNARHNEGRQLAFYSREDLEEKVLAAFVRHLNGHPALPEGLVFQFLGQIVWAPQDVLRHVANDFVEALKAS